ncbi:MAG: hypothetical protein H7287_01730 [Thermoleophilia bacterium]|nr:hypothetical protein [Thermoleophilia bacterium]
MRITPIQIQIPTFPNPCIIGGDIGSPVPADTQALIAPTRGGGCWNPNVPTNPVIAVAPSRDAGPCWNPNVTIQLPNPNAPIQ